MGLLLLGLIRPMSMSKAAQIMVCGSNLVHLLFLGGPFAHVKHHVSRVVYLGVYPWPKHTSATLQLVTTALSLHYCMVKELLHTAFSKVNILHNSISMRSH